MNQYTQYALGAALGAALVIGLLFATISLQIVGKKEFRTHLAVGDRAGFNVETDWIDFGKGMPGNEIVKTITVTNSFERPVKVSIFIDGPVAPFIYPAENGFVLLPGQVVDLELRAFIPEQAPMGDYNGVIRLVYFNA